MTTKSAPMMRAAAPLSDSSADSCGGAVATSSHPVIALVSTTGVPTPAGVSAASVTTPTTRKSRRPSGSGRIGGGTGKEVRGLQRAETLIAQGQTDKAIAQLRKLITDLPNSTRGQLRIAGLLHERRQSAEALAILRSVVLRTPDSAAAREILSEICLEVGRPDEAIEHSRALLQLMPRSLFARDVLSAAYLQCGRLNESLRVIQEMIYLTRWTPPTISKKAFCCSRRANCIRRLAPSCAFCKWTPNPKPPTNREPPSKCWMAVRYDRLLPSRWKTFPSDYDCRETPRKPSSKKVICFRNLVWLP